MKNTAEAGGLVSLACLAVIALYVATVLFAGWLVLIAWNIVVPFFGGPSITYVVAVGIALIISIVGNAFRSINTRG